MDANRRQEVFKRYCEIYNVILSNMYPAKNSTGFPERNLSVNFSKAYETVSNIADETAISWFEMQFGERNNLHVDAVIVNVSASEMLIVESKRFNHPLKKAEEIAKDIGRIYDFISELQSENKEALQSENKKARIDLSKINHCYGVILADVWVKTDGKTGEKKEILNSYIAGEHDSNSSDSFLNKYCKEALNGREFPNLFYNVINMEEVSIGEYKYSEYNLVSFLWQIT